jgi:PST family polysaccharide transporter
MKPAVHRKLLNNDLFQNTVALYGVQFCRKIAPLITVPFLARVLGPSGWGVVAFALSVGTFLSIFIEFGFPLSASREVARIRDIEGENGRVVSGVIGVQVLLCLAGLLVVSLLAPMLPLLRDRPALLLAGIFFGFAQGMTPFWFFQGMERLKMAAVLDMVGKVAGMVGILLLVRTPEDDWKALFLHALGPFITTCAGYFLIFTTIRPRRPGWKELRSAFSQSLPFFAYRLATGLNSTASVFVLGLFAPVNAVGYFASAEKLSTSMLGLLNPIHEAFFPRMSHLAQHALGRAAQLARIGAVVMCAGGLALASILFFFAEPIVRIVVGPGFEPAVPALRIMALVTLLGATANATAMQWLLPLGHYSRVNRIVFGTGLLNVALAAILAAKFSYIGVAWAAVITEACMAVGLFIATARTVPFWDEAQVLVLQKQSHAAGGARL